MTKPGLAPDCDPAAAPATQSFDPCCRRCNRLAQFLDAVRRQHPGYHAAPVAPFGDPGARLLVIGLAPGLHGANRTGRPFTGDYAGVLLYATLHRHGFARQALGDAIEDGQELRDCRISNAVKCLPPDNKPTGEEIRTCNDFLAAELMTEPQPQVLLVLGRIAHDAVLRALGLRPIDYPFGHGLEHALPGGRWLIASYHCSRYNTSTRRLTPEMFDAVVARSRQRLDGRSEVPMSLALAAGGQVDL